MEIIRAILLGLVQALTEFLPISSSAHLILFRRWLGFESVDGLTFDVALHIGTVIAVIAYFRRDLRWLAAGWLRSLRAPALKSDPAQRLAWLIVLGTIPAAVIGSLFSEVIEGMLRDPAVIVVTLAAGGVLFLLAERFLNPTRDIEHVTMRAAIVIGFAQSLALIPGVSRSGITILAGMSHGLLRAEAARYSFLLGVPIMLGAGLKKATELESLALDGYQIAVLLTGAAVSAVAGWLVIKFLLQFLRRHRLDAFAYYRLLLAAVVLLSTLL
jgi:undecaprenyl-diphosphatase